MLDKEETTSSEWNLIFYLCFVMINKKNVLPPSNAGVLFFSFLHKAAHKKISAEQKRRKKTFFWDTGKPTMLCPATSCLPKGSSGWRGTSDIPSKGRDASRRHGAYYMATYSESVRLNKAQEVKNCIRFRNSRPTTQMRRAKIQWALLSTHMQDQSKAALLWWKSSSLFCPPGLVFMGWGLKLPGKGDWGTLTSGMEGKTQASRFPKGALLQSAAL